METIINKKKKIEYIFSDYIGKINKIKSVCKKLREINTESKYIFGLDTFYYQIIIFDSDFTYYKKLYSLNLNRLYNNYYTISKLLKEFVKTYINEDEIKGMLKGYNIFPKYDTLDLYKNYDFSIIHKLYLVNDKILRALDDFIEHNDNLMLKYKKMSENGLNLDNFVISFGAMLDNLKLHTNRILAQNDIFNKSHNEYLDDCIDKIEYTYKKLGSIDIRSIMNTNIKGKYRLKHETNMTKVFEQLKSKKTIKDEETKLEETEKK